MASKPPYVKLQYCHDVYQACVFIVHFSTQIQNYFLPSIVVASLASELLVTLRQQTLFATNKKTGRVCNLKRNSYPSFPGT